MAPRWEEHTRELFFATFLTLLRRYGHEDAGAQTMKDLEDRTDLPRRALGAGRHFWITIAQGRPISDLDAVAKLQRLFDAGFGAG